MASSSFPASFQLSAGVQSYEWGKIGAESKAAQYGRSTPGFEIEQDKPYAELWMGTHPSMPSKALSDGTLLSEIIASDPKAFLGEKVVNHFGPDLPYLFKVLAIGKALSIQAHPDKELGKKLHAERPEIYKDANHKPEMAIAITPFSGFCGFRPLNEISNFLNHVPEFATLIGPDAKTDLLAFSSTEKLPLSEEPKKLALRAVFEALMTADEKLVKEELAKLVKRYRVGGAEVDEENEPEELRELVLTLESQFPEDIGVFCAFLLNVVKLQPGQAAFLKANEPHAYISGDIIECMATSDNVVRAGLTPKLRDVPTLVSMLTYTSAPPTSQLMSATPFRSLAHSQLYDPPIEEFSVLHTTLSASKNESENQPGVEGPSILIFTSGKGTLGGEKVEEGAVWFVKAGEEIELTATEGELEVYRAFVEAP